MLNDDFKCPDCSMSYETEPRKCGCGWINPATERKKETASIERRDSVYEKMPEIRQQSVERVEAAKRKHGPVWRDKLMAELKQEFRHKATLDKIDYREKNKDREEKLRAFRNEAGIKPETSIYASLENFNAHVASLRAQGINVQVIGDTKGLQE